MVNPHLDVDDLDTASDPGQRDQQRREGELDRGAEDVAGDPAEATHRPQHQQDYDERRQPDRQRTAPRVDDASQRRRARPSRAAPTSPAPGG